MLLVPVGDRALRLFEQPPHRAAPRDHLRVRVVQGIASRGQTAGREALRTHAEGEQLGASRMRIVQREGGEDGVLAWLWGPGQRCVLRKNGSHDIIFDRGVSRGLHDPCSQIALQPTWT